KQDWLFQSWSPRSFGYVDAIGRHVFEFAVRIVRSEVPTTPRTTRAPRRRGIAGDLSFCSRAPPAQSRYKLASYSHAHNISMVKIGLQIRWLPSSMERRKKPAVQ